MLAKSEIQKEALDLPAQERIELVVELWDSLAPGQIPGAHSRFPGHALTPTGVMAIRCKQFHLPDL